MLIHGAPDLREEIARDLDKAKVHYERYIVTCNSVDAASSSVLAIAVGSAAALVTQAILSFLERKKGQRKIIIQIDNQSGELRHVEVESPQASEIPELLKQARSVFLEEKKDTDA